MNSKLYKIIDKKKSKELIFLKSIIERKIKQLLPKFNKDKERIENECKCPCRHIARHICREWETLNEVEDIEESSEESDDSDEDYIPPLDDFIVPDEGLKRKERQELNRVLRKLRRN